MGIEAKDELVKIVDGKCLKIWIFDEDRYGCFAMKWGNWFDDVSGRKMWELRKFGCGLRQILKCQWRKNGME